MQFTIAPSPIKALLVLLQLSSTGGAMARTPDLIDCFDADCKNARCNSGSCYCASCWRDWDAVSCTCGAQASVKDLGRCCDPDAGGGSERDKKNRPPTMANCAEYPEGRVGLLWDGRIVCLSHTQGGYPKTAAGVSPAPCPRSGVPGAKGNQRQSAPLPNEQPLPALHVCFRALTCTGAIVSTLLPPATEPGPFVLSSAHRVETLHLMHLKFCCSSAARARRLCRPERRRQLPALCRDAQHPRRWDLPGRSQHERSRLHLGGFLLRIPVPGVCWIKRRLWR